MSVAQPTVPPGIDFGPLWRRKSANPWRLAWLESGKAARWVAANAAVAVVYIGLGTVVARFCGAYGLFPAPIWLPAGIACVAGMVAGSRLMPGIFLGSLLVNWAVLGAPLGFSVVIATANVVAPLVGARATSALRPATGLFTRFMGVLGFILGGVHLQAAITATGGTLALALYYPMSLSAAYHSFAAWWLCDCGGIFFIAPALLLWLGTEDAPRVIDHSGSLIDTLVLIVTLGAATLLFAVPGVGQLVQPEAVFLLTVPLAWITLRISLRAAYTLLTLIYIIATVGTVIGCGPFHGPTIVNPLQSVGLMTVLFAMDSLTLIALTSERREAEARLAEARGTLERATQRTERLRMESLTDPLTAIGNRRYFIVRAGDEFDRARQGKRPYALILLDLDHFKQVNDTGGHAVGDAALQAVGRTLSALTRKQDVLARIGGEEFALALPDTPVDEALELAERLRRTLQQIGTGGIGPFPHKITASFGLTALTPEDSSLDHLLLRADAAVYVAKAKGRNRVEVAAVQQSTAGDKMPA